MRSFAIASCVLALSTGVAFANDLHPFVPLGAGNPLAASAAPGQTGSNVLASCGPTKGYFSIGSQAGGKMNSGAGSPFSGATKKYAGNPGNPATNPRAVSQYDNACAQAALHQGFVPP
jgi:hypothetical protein